MGEILTIFSSSVARKDIGDFGIDKCVAWREDPKTLHHKQYANEQEGIGAMWASTSVTYEDIPRASTRQMASTRSPRMAYIWS